MSLIESHLAVANFSQEHHKIIIDVALGLDTLSPSLITHAFQSIFKNTGAQPRRQTKSLIRHLAANPGLAMELSTPELEQEVLKEFTHAALIVKDGEETTLAKFHLLLRISSGGTVDENVAQVFTRALDWQKKYPDLPTRVFSHLLSYSLQTRYVEEAPQLEHLIRTAQKQVGLGQLPLVYLEMFEEGFRRFPELLETYQELWIFWLKSSLLSNQSLLGGSDHYQKAFRMLWNVTPTIDRKELVLGTIEQLKDLQNQSRLSKGTWSKKKKEFIDHLGGYLALYEPKKISCDGLLGQGKQNLN